MQSLWGVPGGNNLTPREEERVTRTGVFVHCEGEQGQGLEQSVKRRLEKGGECNCKKWWLCVDGNGKGEDGKIERSEAGSEKGDWLVKIDLKDFYLHFDLAEREERRWGVEFGGAWWLFRVAVFGFRRLAEVVSRVSQEEVKEEVWKKNNGVGG